MSWADPVLVIILAAFTVNGAYRGLMRQLIETLGLVLSLIVAVGFYLPLARLLRDALSMPMVSEPLAFAVLLLGTWSVSRLAGILVGSKASHAQHAWADVLGGTVVGLLTGILLLGGIMIALDLLGAPLAPQLAASLVGGWLLGLAHGVMALVPGF